MLNERNQFNFMRLWTEHAETPRRSHASCCRRIATSRLTFLVLWYFAAEKRPCLHLRHGMDFHGRQVNPPGYRGAWKKHADGLGYTIEDAIPWSLLHAADDPPRSGDTLAAAWLVHWSDSNGRDWRGLLIDIVNPAETGWIFQNAATWGRASYSYGRSGSDN